MTPDPAPASVEITREVQASPATVWRFVSDPALMAEWLGAPVEMEPAPGGAFRVRFDRFGTIVEGTVVELVPERRAVFTWGVASGAQSETMPPGSTRVVIELQPAGAGTRVTLRHEGLPTEHERREHEDGWTYYAGQLERVARESETIPRVEGAVDAFVAAWNETDGERRRALLARGFVEDGRFEDVHADARGAAALDAQIAAAQHVMPGFALRRRGPAQVVRSFARFAWTIHARDGAELARGENVAELADDGRLRRVVGFADPPGA